MFFIKNVPGWERIIRLVIGLMALAFAYQNLGASNLGVALGVMGTMLSMTGLVGYCPMCAMAGRKPDKGH